MFGDKIRTLRMKKGLTQTELAKRLYVTPSAVSQWEKNITAPDTERLMALSRELGVALDYFSDTPPIQQPAAPVIEEYTSTEKALIADFRSLSRQGKEFILQTMLVAKNTYSQGDTVVSVVEAV